MINTQLVRLGLPTLLLALLSLPAAAQSFRVQCPTSTITHPTAANNNSEPAYTGPTQFVSTSPSAPANGYLLPNKNVNGAIKCQQISGGDGYSTMADGTQTFMFSFGPLSGLADIAAGNPGSEFPSVFNTVYPGTFQPGDPAATDGASDYAGASGGPGYVTGLASGAAFTFNGAVGLIGDQAVSTPTPGGVTAKATAAVAGGIIDTITMTNTGSGYAGPITITFGPPPAGGQTALGEAIVASGKVVDIDITFAGEGYTTAPAITISPPVTGCGVAGAPTTAASGCLTGHVDPRQIEDVGVMNGNIPAPLMAMDEDDEFFLTLTNVGMIMRPDLFEQHTVHFHGYPNASSFYDGVPDASIAINIGGSFTYYYLAPDAGTYFWHCHITPPEHLQMGMVGQIYVRPRQNRVPSNLSLYTSLQTQQTDPRTACTSAVDILCSNPLPAVNTGAVHGNNLSGSPQLYDYNDGDGMSAYDVEYPLQIHGFDPNFHFVGMTFNPEAFEDMKDKYFLLNGRSYPDTVTPGPLATQVSDGVSHFSQPLPSIINIPVGGKALLRISDLDVTEYQTLASLGIPMHVVGFNAKLLRDQAGNNTDYYTNSITLAGGESLDVVLDACSARNADGTCGTNAKNPGSAANSYATKQVYYLYTPNLDHLSNDAENFGGLMTEVHICTSVDPTLKNCVL